MDPSSRDARAVSVLPLAASLAALGTLLALDVVVGLTYGTMNLPALAVGAAMGVAIVIAARNLAVASVAAGAVSLSVSYVLRDGGISWPVQQFEGGLPGMAEIGGLAYLMCASLRSLSRAQASAIVGLVGIAIVGSIGRIGETGYQPLLVLAAALVMSVAVAAGLYLRWIDYDRSRDLSEARQHERLAIARELHDVVAHHVTGIVVQAQAAQAVWDDRPAAARAAVSQIEAAGAEALGSMRRLVGTLRADEAEEVAPAATLDELERLADRSTALGLPVRMHLEGVPTDLPADLAASVYRIVREAITNSQRHALGATGVDVRVEARNGHLFLQVHDDGRPTTVQHPPMRGYGITGMAERTAALGGRFGAGPGEGRGWLVQAELPLPRS